MILEKEVQMFRIRFTRINILLIITEIVRVLNSVLHNNT